MNYRILIFILLVACSKSELNKDIKLIAHAGTGIYNPQRYFSENSLEAIEYALSFSEVDGVELDVQFSKDGTAWLFHDETLNDRTNGNGVLCEKSDVYLNEISYNGLIKEELTPFYEIDFSNYQDKIFMWDLKLWESCSTSSQVIENFANQIASLNVVENHIVILNNPTYINIFQLLNIKCFFDGNNSENINAMITNNPHYSGVVVAEDVLNKEEINYFRNSKGIEIVVFGVRSPFGVKRGGDCKGFCVFEKFKS